MKNLKKVLALVLAVVMIMGTVAVASAKDYSDVKADNDYAVAIDVLSNLGILDGFPSGEFKPEGLLTRAEAAKIVAIVHNSAIMGSVQSDVADLYKNAQNSFVDCNNSWALPYINYCRITGLADGMTATTYEPNRKLTGVQFLKLMLTTLNFDSAKEGFTGKGWDVNVLRRANEVGLTKGLADGWRGINELKRGEAAQILYNALTKYLVEYGQLVKNNYDTTDRYYKTSFISNEQVARSGYTLAKKMNISVTYTTDAFRRPGYKWSYNSWSKFYMDTPINSYTNAVTMCDVLKNDLGVAETKSSTTALGYLAIDGYKFTATDADELAFQEDLPLPYGNVQYAALAHDGARNCQDKTFGCQGTLTQVFELVEDVDGAKADDPVITEIHTFLSEVTSVDKSTRVTHARGEITGMKVWTYLGIDMPMMLSSANLSYWPELTENQTTSGAKYDVGTKLNVTISLKAAQNAKKDAYVYDYAKETEPAYLDYAKGSVIDVNEPETKVGKLTGASDLKYPETVSVDGTQYYTNCKFIYGKELAMNFANRNNTFKFYYDSYGNVIGCDTNTAASEYVVMDRIYAEHVKGNYVLKADLYDLTGKKIEDATVSSTAGSMADLFSTKMSSWLASLGHNEKLVISDIAANNDLYWLGQLTDALYSYTVDADGVYTLTWVGKLDGFTGDDAYLNGYGRLDCTDGYDAPFQHIAKRANITTFVVGSGMSTVNVTESTKFLCKGVNGEWKAYTGYTELPALTAQYMDYVMEDDNFASVVYLGEVVYAADKIVGYVPTWKAFNWSGNYDVITVYVKGEAVKVNILHDDQPVDLDRDPGVYEFTMAVDKDGVAYATYKKAQFPTLYLNGTVAQGSDKSAIIVIPEGTGVDPDLNEYPAIGLTGVSIYLVKGNTVTAMDKADILVGDHVQIYMDADGEITEIYVIEY